MNLPAEIQVAFFGLIIALITLAAVLIRVRGQIAEISVKERETKEASYQTDVNNRKTIADLAIEFHGKYDATTLELARTREDAQERKAEYSERIGKLEGKLEQQQIIYTDLNNTLTKRVSDLEVSLAMKSRDELHSKNQLEEAQKTIETLTGRVAELEQRQKERHEEMNKTTEKLMQAGADLARVTGERDELAAKYETALQALVDLKANHVPVPAPLPPAPAIEVPKE